MGDAPPPQGHTNPPATPASRQTGVGGPTDHHRMIVGKRLDQGRAYKIVIEKAAPRGEKSERLVGYGRVEIGKGLVLFRFIHHTWTCLAGIMLATIACVWGLRDWLRQIRQVSQVLSLVVAFGILVFWWKLLPHVLGRRKMIVVDPRRARVRCLTYAEKSYGPTTSVACFELPNGRWLGVDACPPDRDRFLRDLQALYGDRMSYDPSWEG